MAGGQIPPPAPPWCTQVSDECTVEGTLYGYRPSLAANAFFVAFFSLGFLLNLGLGIRYKTWTYMIALCLGCGTEAAGYAGRIMLNDNPYGLVGFQVQICCLIIAPAFIAAGIYLTLKHFTIKFGESWSRLRPAWYTYIFITGDLISLILQGAGGGIAATADPGSSFQDVGTNLMITGVVFQVFVLSVFGFLLVEYTLRTYHRRDQLSSESLALLGDMKFRLFVGGILIAFLGIFARCVYRIPELTSGWRSELMRNEPEFIALEGVMITLSALTMTIFHPGFCFPALGKTITKKSRAKSVDEEGGFELMRI